MPLFPSPRWLEQLPEAQRVRAEQKFRLRLAALYLCENGALTDLSESIGYNTRTIASKGRVTPEIAIELERKLTRDFFPREFFRPDIFVVKE